MTGISRAVLTFVAGLGLVAGVAWWSPAAFRQLGLDVWNFGSDLSVLSAARQRSDRIEAECRAARATHREVDALIAGVIEGRLTLAEASDRVRGLNLPAAAFWDLHASSEEERACRLVMHWVAAELRHRPERAAQVTARLESELEAHLARAGLATFI